MHNALPQPRQTPAADPTEDAAARSRQALTRLLLVDDQPMDVQRLSRIFATDYEVLTATSGEQALQICRSQLPDLILLDVMMPDMDGHQVCTQLKADPATRHIPIIFVTGQTDPQEESLGLKLGAVDFISKPVNPTVVRARVKTHITLKSQADLLRESEARLRDFVDMSADWYWESNADMALRIMSDSIKQHFEIIGEAGGNGSSWQLASTVDDAAQHDALRALYEARQPVHKLEVVRLTATGERRWSSVNARPLFAPDGRFCGYRGTGTDITARKRSEMRQQQINSVLQLMTVKTPLAQVLHAIAGSANAVEPGSRFGGIYLLDDASAQLRLAGRGNLPEAFVSAFEVLAPGTATTAGWAAACQGQQVVITDLHADPSWHAHLAMLQGAGMRAGWFHPVYDAQGQVRGLLVTFHRQPKAPSADDMLWLEDDARLAALALERSVAEDRLQLAASVFSNAREGIMITDLDGNFVDVNEAFSQITGYAREDVLGRNPRLLQSGRHGEDFYKSVWRDLLEKGYWQGEIWNRRKDGDIYAEWKTIGTVRDANGNPQHYIGLFSDITLMKEYAEQLERIAHFDALTGLPNRVMLADRLKQAMAHSLRRNRPVAVAYLDLDGFKAINDVHGHGVGDRLLIAVSARMKAIMREGDTLARIGGDEFVAVLVDLNESNDHVRVVTRMLQAAAEPVVDNGVLLHVSASIGLTVYPHDNVDADQLMRHADQAMYQAKQSGKNRFHTFDVAQDAAVKTLRESVDRIRSALENHEFVLFYQPKINMQSGQVIGAEALIRWMHPERGLVAPGEFLPVIEDTPVAVDIGEWVIDAVLAQLSAWQAVGLNMPVSINISAVQLQQSTFLAHLEHLLAQHPDVSPDRIELEILETSALEDIDHISEVIEACRVIGVRFALDDFGTGYSSLTYLKRLGAQVLKIDQSFVRDMLDDPDDLAIVSGIIGLARAFRREVIAEGVETVAHGRQLLALGCTLAQGYAIAHPMPAAQIPDWVAAWRLDGTWVDGAASVASQ